MKTLKQATDKVLKRLEDTDEACWSRTEIDRYIKAGYDRLTRETLCLWDVTYAENVPSAGNYTAPWEEDYFASGWLLLGPFNYTGIWEKDYFANGRGPVCCTGGAWEFTYLDDTIWAGVNELPAELVAVDRVTYDNYKIDPMHSVDLIKYDTLYETQGGPTKAYGLDKDGTFSLRKVPIPAGSATTFTHEQELGLIRQQGADEIETDPEIRGSYGVLRQINKHFPANSQYGFPRRLISDDANVRVEFFRRGHDLDSFEFEIPDRYVKYVELYAMARARERSGPGQDTKLAAHFDQRFVVGLGRLKHRREMVDRERVHAMGGGSGSRSSWPSLPQLPYHYPKPDNWR